MFAAVAQVLVDRASDRVLGMHLVEASAPEIMQVWPILVASHGLRSGVGYQCPQMQCCGLVKILGIGELHDAKLLELCSISLSTSRLEEAAPPQADFSRSLLRNTALDQIGISITPCHLGTCSASKTI